MLRLLPLSLALVVAGPAVAQPVSSIRQAAIERLEQKLGTMRGTIEVKQQRVYLTRTMVERFKPLDGRETFAQRMARLAREENPPALQAITGNRRVKVDGVSMAEIYAMAGIEEIAGGSAALDEGGLDSTNLDDIIAGVDEMIAQRTSVPVQVVNVTTATPPPLPPLVTVD